MSRLSSWLMLVLGLVLAWLILWPRPVLGAESLEPSLQGGAISGASLFAQHCVGCHLNGGNVIRRGKTLRLGALQRAGLLSAVDVARVAAEGQGQMSGYDKVLGPDGAQAVGEWVWMQALADWPKSEQKVTMFPQ